MADEAKLNATVKIWKDQTGRRQISVGGEAFPFFTKGEITVQHLYRTETWVDDSNEEPIVVDHDLDAGHIVMVPIYVMGPVVIEDDPPRVKVLEDLELDPVPKADDTS
jgi:hypothetical protein